MTGRLFLFTLLVSGSLYLPESKAQNLDSLENAIDGILKEKVAPWKENKATLIKDSLYILQYLSEGSRFETINSDSSLKYILKAMEL